MGNITAVEILHKAPNLDILITRNQKKVEINLYTILIVYSNSKLVVNFLPHPNPPLTKGRE